MWKLRSSEEGTHLPFFFLFLCFLILHLYDGEFLSEIFYSLFIEQAVFPAIRLATHVVGAAGIISFMLVWYKSD